MLLSENYALCHRNYATSILLILSQVVFENAIFSVQYLLTPIENSFPPRRHKISPWNSSIRTRGFMFFGSELPHSLYFPVLLLGTRSLEIKALGTALEVLEVVEVDVLEDDALSDLRPEGPSRRAISVVALVSVLCTG